MQTNDLPRIGVLSADPAAVTQFLRRVQALGADPTALLPLSPAAVPDCEPYLCGTSTQSPLPKLRAAVEVLAASGDPQQADFVLDRACYEELTALAKTTGSSFLQGYAALLIDAVNLRAVVRARRLGRGADFLRQVILAGGTVPAADLLASGGEELARLFRGSPLARAAELGGALSAAGSGSLTEFERMCDDGVMDYLRQARRIPFGEEPVIGYLCARQAEATAIRTVMSGRLAGLDGETIRGRLRRTYC